MKIIGNPGVKAIIYIGLILTGLIKGAGAIQAQSHGELKNEPPAVTILSASIKKGYLPGARVYYSISVTDVEDGSSEYDEIAAGEVFLKVQYVHDTAEIRRIRTGEQEPPGLVSARKFSCFTCHNAKSRLIGPSFEDIANKYKKDGRMPGYLVEKVAQGTTGTWGEQIMPPHKDISRGEITAVVQWILTSADDPNVNYFTGLSGTFETSGTGGGVYILTAVYTDHGDTGTPFSGKTGTYSVVLWPGN